MEWRIFFRKTATMTIDLSNNRPSFKQYYPMYIFFAVALAIMAIYTYSKKSQLANDGTICNGAQITSFHGTGKFGPGYALVYTFQIGSDSYSNSTSFYDIVTSDPSVFIGKSFPVIYSSKNPSNSRLLATPKDFAEQNQPFPDSLKWMLNYLKK